MTSRVQRLAELTTTGCIDTPLLACYAAALPTLVPRVSLDD
ncbi:hypothetical protein [Pseudomonas rhizoryzae]|nr:hypothetical protein [Pseudomonas rhizoryzae]